MSAAMDRYDLRKDEGWRAFYKNDPAFEHGESTTAKVTSFFCKRRSNEPEVTIPKEYIEKEVDYEYQVNVEWVSYHLKRVLKNKKKFYGNEDLYQYIVLTDYVKQCEDGRYKQCIISWQELYLLKPKSKKKK